MVNDLDDAPAREVVEEIRKTAARRCRAPGSVTGDRLRRPAFVGTAVDTFGGVDIIINNAGYTWDNVIQKMTDEQWDAIVDVHLKAPFDILRAAQPVISAAVRKERADGLTVHRKVVNISSVAGLFGNAGQANYSAAKAGIVGPDQDPRQGVGPLQRQRQRVAFGFIQTRLTEAAADGDAYIDVEGRQIKVGVNPQLLEARNRAIPLGRAGTPEEAAGSVVMLTYPEADYVSGQVIVTGGGFEG